MQKMILGAAALVGLSLSAASAFAIAVPKSYGFNGVATSLNTTPAGWTSIGGTVDTIQKGNQYGITCYNDSKGCVDLDGSTGNAGVFTTTGTFALKQNQTYSLSAQISGNQRDAGPDSLLFGFTTKLANPLSHIVAGQSKEVDNIQADSSFALYELVFKASANESVHAFFYNLFGGDNRGLVIDNVSIKAVPLPAAAWLFLSGLIALGAIARRNRSSESVPATAAAA